MNRLCESVCNIIFKYFFLVRKTQEYILHIVIMFRTQSIFFCSFYVIAALILKGNEQFSLSADQPMQYDIQNKTVIAEGNASLTGESILLMANAMVR